VTLRAATATLAVRGGAFIVQIQPGGQLNATFLYGKALTVTGAAGVSQTLTRPGFMITVSGPGAAPHHRCRRRRGSWRCSPNSSTGSPGVPAAPRSSPPTRRRRQRDLADDLGNVTQSTQQAAQNEVSASTLRSNPTIPPRCRPRYLAVQSTAPQAAAVAITSTRPRPDLRSVWRLLQNHPELAVRAVCHNSSTFNIPTRRTDGADGSIPRSSTVPRLGSGRANGGSLTFGDYRNGVAVRVDQRTSFITADRTFLYSNNLRRLYRRAFLCLWRIR